MNLEKIWQEFKVSDKSKNDLFIKYCKENIKSSDIGNITIQKASYNICAACMLMSENDSKNIISFEDIQNISCDLEIPDEYRDRPLDDWNKLKNIIEKQVDE